jgi:transposase
MKVPYEIKGMEKYFDDSWEFGTAKLVFKHGKYFLHIPMTKEIADPDAYRISNVVGVDFGINFTATTYDSKGRTHFFFVVKPVVISLMMIASVP